MTGLTQFLVDRGADLWAKDKDGKTALDVARGDLGIAQSESAAMAARDDPNIKSMVLPSLRDRQIVISIVSVEELLRARRTRRRRSRHCSGLRFKDYILPRRGGAPCCSVGADVVGADRVAFERLGVRYLRFR